MASTAEPLVHIGCHKTGTTWLQRGIFNDPAFFTRVWPRTIIDEAFVGGNPFTFDPNAAAGLMQPFVDSAAHNGTVPVISHERLWGQPLLGGYDAGQIADRLHATFPNARILIVIREQKAMLLSIYKQYVKVSGTQRVGGVWRDYTQRERRRPTADLDVFEYHHIIGYYQRLFGKDRVLVLPFEELRRDDLRFAGEVTKFVGLPAPTDVPKDRENVAVPGILLAALRVSNIALKTFGLAEAFDGPIADNRIRGIRLRTIRRIGPKIPAVLSRPFERRLRKAVDELAEGRFDESNRVTSELTGLDLASYGYAH